MSGNENTVEEPPVSAPAEGVKRSPVVQAQPPFSATFSAPTPLSPGRLPASEPFVAAADPEGNQTTKGAAALSMPLFQIPPETTPAQREQTRANADAPDEIPGGTGAERDVDDEDSADDNGRRRRRRGGRGRRGRSVREDEAAGPEPAGSEDDDSSNVDDATDDAEESGSRRRRRRRRGSSGDDNSNSSAGSASETGGSTRLDAKRQRRRDGREAGRRRVVITEAEFLARRESVERVMVVQERDGRTQIAVIEDNVLVEHYVAHRSQGSMIGNVYLGRVQNVLPGMEAAFVDIGKGRNAVLYAGEVNWDAAGLESTSSRRIEHALKTGESVLVQVTKDPIGHKGARLTSQISLAGRYLVYVPDASITGISRKLPDTERNRLKQVLREVLPEDAGVIVRTAAEGASEDELRRDVARLTAQWQDISAKSQTALAPELLYGEPDLAIKVVRDIFNEDFSKLVISGEQTWGTLHEYLSFVAPDLMDRVERAEGDGDVFADYRVDEQLAKAVDRKVWLPSGGSLVIDRTEAMTVVDVNTGRFVGAGGNLEDTVTQNNLEAAEEIVRQLRLRDIGGIVVVDFIDMVVESNRDLVLRRLVECLGRDRTKHQVSEVTSLGLVQMTRKRIGQGLVEAFSEPCATCAGRGIIIHDLPAVPPGNAGSGSGSGSGPRMRTSKTVARGAARVAAASVGTGDAGSSSPDGEGGVAAESDVNKEHSGRGRRSSRGSGRGSSGQKSAAPAPTPSTASAPESASVPEQSVVESVQQAVNLSLEAATEPMATVPALPTVTSEPVVSRPRRTRARVTTGVWSPNVPSETTNETSGEH